MAGSEGGSGPVAGRRGLFISFEGGDGAGKSTQIRMLAEKLRAQGLEVVVSREPGGTPGAEAVRHVVLDTSAAEPFGAYLEAILFAAARNDHVEQKIRPALNAGRIVLVDRFMDSTRVYQGASGDLDPEFLKTLEKVAVAGVVPDLTIILDLDPEEGLRRAHARRDSDVPVDRFEKEDVSAHALRREAFLEIARREPERCRVIDASGAPEKIADQVWNAAQAALSHQGEADRARAKPDGAKGKSERPSAHDRLLGFRE